MQLLARLDLYFPTSAVERSPGLWNQVSALWSGSPARVRATLEAVVFVYEFRTVLSQLGIDNARSLVIDGVTVFRDLVDAPGDLPELMVALSEHTSVFGEDCDELRMAVETEEAGLHLMIEATVKSEHAKDAPSVRLSVLGRRTDLHPTPGESASSYRDRIDHFLANPRSVSGMQLQFSEFLTRLQGGLSQAFMDARFEVTTETLITPLPRYPSLPPKTEPPAQDAAALLERSSPPRNFSLSLEQRIGALMSGAPAYSVRLNKIEALEQKLLSALAEPARATSAAIPVGVVRALEDLNTLIAEHNRYYPIEKSLPIDLATGDYSEMGATWHPKPAATIESLLLRARARGA